MARILHWCVDQTISSELEKMDLTAAQGRIMGYLVHSDRPRCSRDIEEEFQLSHPTVSGLLSRLEQKDFLEFRPDPEDRRCKRIYILPKGQECAHQMYEIFRTMERQIVLGFTPEEQALFASLLQRAITNMGGSPCHPKHKEESNE